jgi:hypothetical protein
VTPSAQVDVFGLAFVVFSLVLCQARILEGDYLGRGGGEEMLIFTELSM